jgi:thioesterase domain-containing protein
MQAPGYDGAEPALGSVESIAQRYVDDIRAVQQRGPYTIGGYSFGGLVAYEIGCRLRLAGEEVTDVVMLDSHIPVPGQRPPVGDERTAYTELVAVHRAMTGAQGTALEVDPDLSLAECRALVCRELSISGVVSVERQLDRLLPVYQRNLEANVSYRPSPSDLAVTVLRATDPFPPVFGVKRRPAMRLEDPCNGWSSVGAASVRVREIPVGHFTMFAEGKVGAVADALRLVLEESWFPDANTRRRLQ